MDQTRYNLYIAAGLEEGKEKTCGKKVFYIDEPSAARIAESMNDKFATQQEFEPYPCAFCKRWHIGRRKSEAELKLLSGEEDVTSKRKRKREKVES